MAFCFECGVLMHHDDLNTHVCEELDKPKKGVKIKFAKQSP